MVSYFWTFRSRDCLFIGQYVLLEFRKRLILKLVESLL